MLGDTVGLFIDFSNPESFLIYILFFGGVSVLYMVFMPQLMGLQASFAMRGAKGSLKKLKGWADDSKKITLNKLSNYGRSNQEIKEELEEFLDFFTIEPVSDDPSGVLDRLDHLLDVRDSRYESKARSLAPDADEEEVADLQMVLEGTLSTHSLYKLVRHYLKVAEKSGSYQLVQLLQLRLPLLEKMGEAYFEATKAFKERKVIGDGLGPMVAARLIGNAGSIEEVRDTVFAETEIESRRTLVVKAKGPGGRVGKPGELIEKLADKEDIDRIIMVDAGLKLEGEESGKVVEGVGAAIGGPPTEKHKIEEIATEREIPVDAIIVKEGLKEAIVPMSKDLSKSVDQATEKIKNALIDRTEEDETLVVAGIGNTIGIGQRKEDIPTDFPDLEKDEEELESFSDFGGVGLLKSKFFSLFGKGGIIRG